MFPSISYQWLTFAAIYFQLYLFVYIWCNLILFIIFILYIYLLMYSIRPWMYIMDIIISDIFVFYILFTDLLSICKLSVYLIIYWYIVHSFQAWLRNIFILWGCECDPVSVSNLICHLYLPQHQKQLHTATTHVCVACFAAAEWLSSRRSHNWQHLSGSRFTQLQTHKASAALLGLFF